jgi:septal ring factor EnvC (AmiA/AmiB activator)
MELTGNETWIAAGVGMIGMIVSFFFGKAGVFQKTVDFIFKSKETRAMKIEDEISAREARIKEQQDQIKEMAHTMESLKTRINELDKDLIKTTTYVKTLLSYLETLLPDGANPFIVELAKEIRKSNTEFNKDGGI